MFHISLAGNQAPRVLIADDDPAILGLMALRLAGVGFEVETAQNGLQALIRARRNAFELVVIDVNMPGADGISVSARLLSQGGRAAEVIVVSGFAATATVERCESLGAFFIRKGPDFWTHMTAVLTKLFPGLTDSIRALETHPSGAEMRGNPRVLVLDQDAGVERMLASRLGKCGVDTLHAADAPHGYHAACKAQPSVIISDYALANGGVNYLLWKLRSTPATAAIPVFLMSDGPLDESTRQQMIREVCGRHGVERFFIKPLDVDVLFPALQQHCAFESNGVGA